MKDGKVRVVCLSRYDEAEDEDRNVLREIRDAMHKLEDSVSLSSSRSRLRMTWWMNSRPPA